MIKMFILAPDPSNYCILISNIKVSCNKSTLNHLWELRSLLDQVLAAKINKSNINTASGNVFENQVLE